MNLGQMVLVLREGPSAVDCSLTIPASWAYVRQMQKMTAFLKSENGHFACLAC